MEDGVGRKLAKRRQRKRWMENARNDMEKSGLREENAWNRTSWRKKIQMPQRGSNAR